ncbi:DUF6279 family lipoprotein [Bdellovibrio sp. 22V]|uniref:DUF6279 family lipoprotein n=1 Tax=Bdellovibrio TaxID=958 RepID=UPI0025431411|nr:DUF6279 family lipoprotein [Bdellovibrio sp. 22V]WII72339.1 DUF6279 family lipoprotein [Bdellovibrio sp. 22V]
MRYLFLIFILFNTLACSRSDVLVRFFDTLAVSEADDYFDLTSEQKENLKKNIQKDLGRAKKELFPEVAKKLRELEPAVAKDTLDAQKVAAQFADFQTYVKKFSSYFKDSAIKTTLSLKPSQYDHFSGELHKEIQKSEDRNGDSDHAQREAYKRYRRSLEFWVGGISKDQRDRLNKFLETHPFPWKLQNQNKEHVLSQFLEARKNPETLKKFVGDFYEDFEAVRLPAYTEALDAHKKAFQNFLVNDFWKTLSEVQRKRLRENILDRAQELEKIAEST